MEISEPRTVLREFSRTPAAGVLRAGLLLLTVAYAVNAVRVYRAEGHVGLDSHAYWLAGRSDVPWGLPPGHLDAFLYSPVFHQAVQVPALLPWPVFAILWSSAEAACFLWLTRDLGWWARAAVLMMTVPAVLYGNVMGMLAVMAVVGLKRPGVWAFAFLTKVTIGAAGLVWFVARGEWRKAAEVLGVLGAVVMLSAAWDPGAWSAWLEFLTSNQDAGSGGGWGRWVRYSLFVGLVWFAARRNWAWVLPTGLLGFSSHLNLHVKDLAQLTAIPKLLRQSASSSRTRGTTSSP